MQAYMDAVSNLARRLLRVIALALSLPPDFFKAHFDKPLAFLRPLHYSAQVSLPQEVICIITFRLVVARGTQHDGLEDVNFACFLS